jgi:hypothetical protein
MKSKHEIEFMADTCSDSTLEGELGLVKKERFQERDTHNGRREFERWLKRAKSRIKGYLNAYLSLTITDMGRANGFQEQQED